MSRSIVRRPWGASLAGFPARAVKSITGLEGDPSDGRSRRAASHGSISGNTLSIRSLSRFRRRPQLLPALPPPDGSALSAKYAAAAVSASTRAPARFSARPSAPGSSCPSTVTVQRKRSAPCTLVSRTAHRAPPSGLTISSALGLMACHRDVSGTDPLRCQVRSPRANLRRSSMQSSGTLRVTLRNRVACGGRDGGRRRSLINVRRDDTRHLPSLPTRAAKRARPRWGPARERQRTRKSYYI